MLYFSHRYFKHLTKLIEAAHILNSTHITRDQLNKAHDLLELYVKEFEENYGPTNMVFNVHLLLHKTKSVIKNGPLQTYSNYAFEDYIGYLAKFVLGPTDVLNQITDRYLLKKSLDTHLQDSEAAKEFNDKIEYKHFSKTTKHGGFILVGKPRKLLDLTESAWIINELNTLEFEMDATENIFLYRAVFVEEKIYYETFEESTKVKTNDAFVCDTQLGICGDIKHIILAKQNIFFVINNKYALDESIGIPPYIYKLVDKQDEFRIITPVSLKYKYAFVKIDCITMCAKFPNLYERN